jgi:hypothetical protein
MAILSYLLGPAQVFLPQKVSTLVTGLSGILVTAAATTPSTVFNNSISSSLSTTATYTVAIAPIGNDINGVGGLTCAGGTAATGSITVSAGQGINVTMAANVFPANLNLAMFMGVFLNKNDAGYKLVDLAYIDATNGFNYTILHDADTTTSYTIAQITALTLDATAPELGARVCGGVTFTRYKTSGGVFVDRDVQEVTYKPDDGSNYPIPTTRTAAIRFSILANDMLQTVIANAGTYGAVPVNGHVVTTANMSMQTAVGQITGNLPLMLLMPPDANKVRAIRLYASTIQNNSQGSPEAWEKDNPTLLAFKMVSVSIDPLLTDINTEVVYKYV